MTDYTDASWSADDLEFKAVSGQLNVDEARGIVECFVAAVGNKDSVGDIVAPGAFDGSLRRRKPRVVWGHDWNQPIGKVLAIEEVPSSDSRLPEKMQAARVGGLLARVQFNLKSERGREAFYSVAFFGTDQEWSIGYKTIKAAYDPTAQANVLQEVELFEVSPVLHGANQLTGTISIKSMHGDMGMDESEDSNDPKGYDSEWSDWADKDDDSYEMPERDESPAESFVGRRRVRMVMGEHGIGEIYSGSNRHQVSLDELNNDGSSINGEDRPGLGGAVSKAVNSSIQMRITQPNFVIFDMASEDGDMDTFFMPYHYDAQGGQYMFGDSMEVEVEMNVKFGMGSDEEYESDGKSAYDPALSADDFEDLEEKGLLGRIGRGIVRGGGSNPLRGRNPKDVVDRNNDGWLFSGPNRIRAVERQEPDRQAILRMAAERERANDTPLRPRNTRLRTDSTGNLVRSDNGNFITDDPTVHRPNLPSDDPSRHSPLRGGAPKKKPADLTSNRMEKPGTPFKRDLEMEREFQSRGRTLPPGMRPGERWNPDFRKPKDGIIRPKDNPRRKKPSADKPAALALWEFDHREFDPNAPRGSRNPVFAEKRRNELLRAAKLEDRNFVDEERYEGLLSGAKPLTMNRMEKPGKPSTQMTYAERKAQQREIDKAKIEASDAKLRKLEADRKAGMDRDSLVRDKRDFAKVQEAEGHKGNGYKMQPRTKLSNTKDLIVPPTGRHEGDTLSPDILDQMKEGDVVTFGEPGKDAMSTGVVRRLFVNEEDNENVDSDYETDFLDNNPNLEIYVTHFDGVPIKESSRYTVTAGGEPDVEPGAGDRHMDLKELIDGLSVFKGDK